MGEKKRKSTSAGDDRPNKKQQTIKSVAVDHISGSDNAKPVFASSPGITVSSDVSFRSYSQSKASGTSSLLLHSSNHPTIDYTATERNVAGDQYLKHYVAVFDSVSGKLQVTEARNLTVRSSVRRIEPARDSDDENDAPATNYTSRAALTQTFGTKKSKKAVQSMAENRLLAQGGEGAGVTKALISNALVDEDMTEASTQETSRSNKPLPPADVAADDVENVYKLEDLVFPGPWSKTLKIMPIGPWIARMNAKKEIKDLRSRFVANRVGYIGKALLASPQGSDPKLTQSFQLLRYIGLLLEINTYVSRLSRKRAVLPPQKWPENTVSAGTPPSILYGLLTHFLPDRLPTTFALTFLRTTILALTLRIPPPSHDFGVNILATEPTDISLDMAMEAVEVRKLYRELGCKVEAPTEAELRRWGFEKTKKGKNEETGAPLPKAVFAKLSFPLQFPKTSSGRPAAKR